MATTTSTTYTLSYADTEFTRKMKFDGVANEALSGITAGVKAINASLAAGTDDGLSVFFVSDDNHPLAAITSVATDIVETTPIDIND